MPKLNDQLIRKTPSKEKVYFLWDTEIKGLGVKITPSGGKTFVFQWQQPHSKPSTKRRKIGNCRDISVARAREIAKTAKGKIKNQEGNENQVKVIQSDEKNTKSIRGAKRRGRPTRKADIHQLEDELLHYFDQAGITTKDKIISVATKLFINKGFDISLETIAQHSGYTRLTIYRYFKNKELLTNAVIDQVADRFFEIDPHPIDYDAPPHEAMLAFATKFRHLLLSEQHISFYLLLNSVSKEKSLNLFEQVVVASHKKNIKMVSDYFDFLVGKGVLRPLKTQLLAEHFLVSIPGVDRTRLQKGLLPKAPREEAEYLETLVDSFLHGVMAS